MNNNKIKKINTSELREAAPELKYGDKVELSGIIYTARDAAHMKICALLDENKPLPGGIKINGAVIYYAGPTGLPVNIKRDNLLQIGSCGPTTSGRMDRFTPRLLNLGLAGMIGKGERNAEVIESIVKNKAVYFSAIGGAGALAAQCVKSCEVVAFPELGCESLKKLYILNFPMVVAVDSYGGDIFKEGRKLYSMYTGNTVCKI